MSNPSSLAGKTAAVIGASRGIGFAIAVRFAREGANVVMAARTTARLQIARHALRQVEPWPVLESPQQHSIAAFDAQVPECWAKLVEQHVSVKLTWYC